MVKVREDLTGMVFGMLTVIRQVDDYITPKGRHYDRWLCKCECGKELIVVGYHLKEKNKIKSCGCYSKTRIIEFNKKYNIYDMDSFEYGVGYTSKGEEFWFDKEDYDLIQPFYWYYSTQGYLHAANPKEDPYSLGVTTVAFHRLVMNAYGLDKDIDHIVHPDRNGNKIDNRKSNLRFVNDSLNSQNRTRRSDNTSGCTGVYYNKRDNKWIANICIEKKRIVLGAFNNKDDAIKARKDAEIKYFGDYRYDAHNTN